MLVHNNKLYIVMEYCEKGDLADYLNRMHNNLSVVSPSTSGQLIGE